MLYSSWPLGALVIYLHAEQSKYTDKGWTKVALS